MQPWGLRSYHQLGTEACVAGMAGSDVDHVRAGLGCAGALGRHRGAGQLAGCRVVGVEKGEARESHSDTAMVRLASAPSAGMAVRLPCRTLIPTVLRAAHFLSEPGDHGRSEVGVHQIDPVLKFNAGDDLHGPQGVSCRLRQVREPVNMGTLKYRPEDLRDPGLSSARQADPPEQQADPPEQDASSRSGGFYVVIAVWAIASGAYQFDMIDRVA